MTILTNGDPSPPTFPPKIFVYYPISIKLCMKYLYQTPSSQSHHTSRCSIPIHLRLSPSWVYLNLSGVLPRSPLQIPKKIRPMESKVFRACSLFNCSCSWFSLVSYTEIDFRRKNDMVKLLIFIIKNLHFLITVLTWKACLSCLITLKNVSIHKDSNR